MWNANKPEGPYAKWNKPIRERQILCDSTYAQYLKMVKLTEAQNRMMDARG